jgi:hypothetical protein
VGAAVLVLGIAGFFYNERTRAVDPWRVVSVAPAPVDINKLPPPACAPNCGSR